MNKIHILTALALCSLLGACATRGPDDGIGKGEYFTYIYPGSLPHVEDSRPAEWGPEQGDQMTYLDRNCRAQMAQQEPSALKSIGTTTLRTAIPIAIGGGLGTAQGIKSVASAAKGYASYGAWSAGGSGAGAGIGGGIDRHLTGNRYTQAGCMNAAVTEAKKRDGALSGIHIIFNADAVNGQPLKRPVGQSTAMAKARPDPSAEGAETPPHP